MRNITWFLSQELLPMLSMFSLGLGLGKQELYGMILGCLGMSIAIIFYRFNLIKNPYTIKEATTK